MSTDISVAMDKAIEYLRENRDEAKYTDSAATAILEDSLRVEVTGPGRARVYCPASLATTEASSAAKSA
jgi:hypothetical protein